MKKNKLILFDWGNIVESHTLDGYSCEKAWKDLFLSCGYDSDEDFFPLLKKYELSSISNIDVFRDVYKKMKKEFGFNTSLKKFIDLYYYYFNKIDYYIDVKDYEHSLRDKCYIGILSNLMIFDKNRLDRQVDLSKYDFVFLSFELECKKPDIVLFEKVQSQLPFSKDDILFIDDRKENIKVAKKFGWNTLCATALELDKIKDVCNKFLDM